MKFSFPFSVFPRVDSVGSVHGPVLMRSNFPLNHNIQEHWRQGKDFSTLVLFFALLLHYAPWNCRGSCVEKEWQYSNSVESERQNTFQRLHGWFSERQHYYGREGRVNVFATTGQSAKTLNSFITMKMLHRVSLKLKPVHPTWHNYWVNTFRLRRTDSMNQSRSLNQSISQKRSTECGTEEVCAEKSGIEMFLHIFAFPVNPLKT